MRVSSAKRPITPFIPKTGGNRTAPKAEQLEIDINPMSVDEYETERAAIVEAHLGASQSDLSKALRAGIIASRVPGVRKLESDLVQGQGVDANGVPVPPNESIGAFFVRVFSRSNDAEHSDMLDETFSAITKASVLAEGAAKN